ncbi:MAG: MBOAT family protein [Clostridia bacterium]|nr:MBOAT family protein [Clostridia bacterium]
MTYTSYKYLLFVGALVFLYYIIPNKFKKFQWVLLLIANYIFYYLNGVPQIIFIVASTALTYGSTMLMQKLRNDNNARVLALGEDVTREQKREFKKQTQAKIKKVQVATIALHLIVLAVVKYTNVTITNANTILDAFKVGWDIPHVSMIVPLGISFYTFASLSYILDVARGKYEPERNFFKVALFVSYFPNIVQGPICRFDEVGTQLIAEHHFDYDRFVHGAELVLWGFFKKLVIADRANMVLPNVFSASVYEQNTGSQFIFGIVFAFIHLYADFSGGIDITRGVSEILGTDLPLNFERPLYSQSLGEFWRRWHMTLGGFMRDYVFYPVMLSKPVLKLSQKANKKWGKFAGKMVPSVITPAVVFFLMGIWHGASYQYLLYGVYNAFMVSSAVAFDGLFKKMKKALRINDQAYSYKLFCMFRVFCITSVSRLIVNAPSIKGLGFIIKSMFTNLNPDFFFNLDGKLFTMGVDAKNMLILFLAIIIFATVSILQEHGMHIRDSLNKQNLVFKWFILISLFVIVLIFGIYGRGYDAASFLYQAF